MGCGLGVLELLRYGGGAVAVWWGMREGIREQGEGKEGLNCGLWDVRLVDMERMKILIRTV